MRGAVPPAGLRMSSGPVTEGSVPSAVCPPEAFILPAAALSCLQAQHPAFSSLWAALGCTCFGQDRLCPHPMGIGSLLLRVLLDAFIPSPVPDRLHSATSEHLSWDLELSRAVLLFFLSPSNPYPPAAPPAGPRTVSGPSQGPDTTAPQEAAHPCCSV